MTAWVNYKLVGRDEFSSVPVQRDGELCDAAYDVFEEFGEEVHSDFAFAVSKFVRESDAGDTTSFRIGEMKFVARFDYSPRIK